MEHIWREKLQVPERQKLENVRDVRTHMAPCDLQLQTLFRSSPRQRSVEAGNEQKPDAEVALKAPEQQKWTTASSEKRQVTERQNLKILSGLLS